MVARLDNQAQLESAILLAEANLAVRQATLVQTRAAVQNSRNEALASLAQARAVASEATASLSRTTSLAAACSTSGKPEPLSELSHGQPSLRRHQNLLVYREAGCQSC